MGNLTVKYLWLSGENHHFGGYVPEGKKRGKCNFLPQKSLISEAWKKSGEILRQHQESTDKRYPQDFLLNLEESTSTSGSGGHPKHVPTFLN